MAKKIIAIDVDDVLAAHADAFVRFSNNKWQTNFTADDYDEHWAKMWKVDIDEALRRRDDFVSSGVHADFMMIDESSRVLTRLSKDFELRIVTSRLMSMKDGTIDWIQKSYPDVFHDEQIHFAGIWDNPTLDSFQVTKAGIIESLNADYLIDDQLKHCQAVAACGRRALLFGNYGWNQTSKTLSTRIIRVENWLAVESYFYG